MNIYEIGHRFCNKDFGKNGHLTCGNVSVSGRNYYSYSTVFAQWVDFGKNVCLVFWGKTSTSSSGHQLRTNMFPSDVTILPYDDESRWSWSGCELMSWQRKDEDFNWDERVILIDHWVDKLYRQFLLIVNDGTKKDLDKIDFSYWEYINKLCSLYRDTSVKKWLKMEKASTNESANKKKMVKLLNDGVRDVRTITDALFGKGSFQRYYDYCERYRKASCNKARVLALCERIGISNPYRGWGNGVVKLTANEVRKLSAKERNEIHFRWIEKKKLAETEKERKEKAWKNMVNAYKWIMGCEPIADDAWYGKRYDLEKVQLVTNMYTHHIYNLQLNYNSFSYFHGLPYRVEFDYDEFSKANDKEAWIKDFYKKCEEAEKNISAQEILFGIDAPYEGVKFGYTTYKSYIDDENLRNRLSDEDYAICHEYIGKFNKAIEDDKARKRAQEIARQREIEEQEREKKLQEELKKEKIDECLSRGVEGARDLWRLHYKDINSALSASDVDEAEFYSGGNVLMRLSMNKDVVETSKRIRIDVDTCKRFWKIVERWHNDPSKFKPIEIKTHYSGTYTIIRYNNDILTSGCHDIAYAEMKRLYEEILTLEKTAV